MISLAELFVSLLMAILITGFFVAGCETYRLIREIVQDIIDELYDRHMSREEKRRQ
jgi:hypothetical protein